MKIDFLCSHGSSLGVTCKSIWGDEHRVGVGGSELALLTLCEEFTKRGDEVVLYNDPFEGGASPFEQRPVHALAPRSDRDALIVFRYPNPVAQPASGIKVWWCTDPPQAKEYAFSMDRLVCISPYQYKLHEDIYEKDNFDRLVMIDVPIRVDDYNKPIEKVPGRVIFSSVPARGLDVLCRMWPAICDAVPDASLVITSDYRLWGSSPSNGDFVKQWLSQRKYAYVGAVSREQLIVEQLKAQIHLYPSLYEENFCLSLAESEVAGAYTISNSIGALGTTNMGTVLELDAGNPANDAEFVRHTVELLGNPSVLKEKQLELQKKAVDRFSPKTVLEQWDKQVFS